MRLASVFTAAVLSFVFIGAAQAVPIQPGNTTDLTFNSAFSSRGIEISPLGNATLDTDSTVSLPITGGSRRSSDVALFIDHTNSGLKLTAGFRNVKLENFFINTASSTVFADVSTGGEEGRPLVKGLEDVFTFNAAPGALTYALSFTSSVANVMNEAFTAGGSNIFRPGTEAGVATTNPIIAGSGTTTPVPAPGSFSLLLFAFSLVGMGRLAAQRRRAG